jgi:hypothetical protein
VVRTISVDRLGKRIAVLPMEDVQQIVVGLMELVG